MEEFAKKKEEKQLYEIIAKQKRCRILDAYEIEGLNI